MRMERSRRSRRYREIWRAPISQPQSEERESRKSASFNEHRAKGVIVGKLEVLQVFDGPPILEFRRRRW